MALTDNVPSQAFDVQKKNMEVLDSFANSFAESVLARGAPNGKPVLETISGIQNRANTAIQAAGSVPLGVWFIGAIYNNLNETYSYNGISYKPKASTPMPYTTVNADATLDPGVQAYTDVNIGNLGDFTVLRFDTLDEAINDVSVNLNNALLLKERILNGGGGAVWDVVLTSTVTPNTYNIVQSVVVPSLSLILRLTEEINPLQWGLVGDGVVGTLGGTNNTPIWQAALDAAAGRTIIIPPSASGDPYFIASDIFVKSNTTMIGRGGTILCGGASATIKIINEESIIFDKISVDGNQLVWVNTLGSVILMNDSDHITVRDSHIFNGVESGIGVKQSGTTVNRNVSLLNNHIHNIGLANHPNSFFAFGNGISVTSGENIEIKGNHIHDIHGVGCINLEGFRQFNITVDGNQVHTTTGAAAGIKAVAFGVDTPAINIHIINNHVFEVGDLSAPTTEPAIWIEAGDGVIVDNNFVYDCPAVGSAGKIVVNSDTVSRVTNNTIRRCDGGSLTVNTAQDVYCEGNVIECTATSTLAGNDVPLYVESTSSGEGTLRVVGNVIKDAPIGSIIFNPRSRGILTENTIVRTNRTSAGFAYSVSSQTGFQNSIIGGNVIVDDGNSNANFFYNFSGSGHADMTYIQDLWQVNDLSTFPKYDLSSNPNFIQSDIALRTSAPTSGFNSQGRVVLNANIVELGAVSSKYTISGWNRATSSTNNALGTDWLEMRVLTGN